MSPLAGQRHRLESSDVWGVRPVQANWSAFPPPGGFPGFFNTFAAALARAVGRRVRVVTDCQTVTGRLVAVGDDFIRVRRRGRDVLIRFARVCFVGVKRRSCRFC